MRFVQNLDISKMKKSFLTIIIILGCILNVTQAYTQEQGETLRERLARRQAQEKGQSTASQNLTVRAQLMNESQTQEIGNAPWIREIYRFLNLEKEKNASLYFPVKPMGTRMNLFSMIFKHILDGSITVYEYQLDGSEDFSEKYIRKPEDILKGFEIMYTEENGKYIVEDVDIPNNEVLGYFLKEAWYFDKNNSVVDTKILAICPVLVRQDDFGAESTRYPMFWVPYESIRPYASQMPIMTSSLNNASTQTINDFFIKHNFDGEIYKTTNVRNLSLAQMFPSEEAVKKEQKKIETQIKQFNDNLWMYNDSIGINERAAIAASSKSKKGEKKGAEISGGSITKDDAKDRATVQKQAKQQKSSPARSMRNRKRN